MFCPFCGETHTGIGHMCLGLREGIKAQRKIDEHNVAARQEQKRQANEAAKKERRERIAVSVAQGLLTGMGCWQRDRFALARKAAELADALMEELDREGD